MMVFQQCRVYTLWCRCMSNIIVPLCHVVIESYRHQKLNELRYIKTKKKHKKANGMDQSGVEWNGLKKKKRAEQVKVERLMTFYFSPILHLFLLFTYQVGPGVRARPQPFFFLTYPKRYQLLHIMFCSVLYTVYQSYGFDSLHFKQRVKAREFRFRIQM